MESLEVHRAFLRVDTNGQRSPFGQLLDAGVGDLIQRRLFGGLGGACMRAAQDGLLPDGREGALVIFNQKDGNQWIKKVQWMPMVFGLLKKARQSGEIASIEAHCWYENDFFRYVLGDEPRIEHEPFLGGDRGALCGAYMIARFKDPSLEPVREVMSVDEIEKVRRVSKSGASKEDGSPIGIWQKWYDEMARKTVLRRGAKYLPMSSEIERALNAEDVASVSAAKTAGTLPAPQAPQADPIEIEYSADEPAQIAAPQTALQDHDPDTGEVLDGPPAGSEPPPHADDAPDAGQPAPQGNGNGNGNGNGGRGRNANGRGRTRADDLKFG